MLLILIVITIMNHFQSYKQWKDALPDMSWLDDLLPPPEKLDTWQQNAIELKNKVSGFEFDPRLRELTRMKYADLKSWFDERLETAINASAEANPDFDRESKPILRNYN